MAEVDNIKVYRVLPDNFSEGPKRAIANYESLYYYMGYTQFKGKIKHYPYYSSIQYLQEEEGKYFFLFPEDALLCSSTLVTGNTCKIVEYIFPIDVATKLMGQGEYDNRAIGYNEVTEIIIGKSYFTGNSISSLDVEYADKLIAALRSLKDTYGIKGKVSESEEKLSDALSQSLLFCRFASDKSDLVCSNEMSGKVVTIFNGGYDSSNVNEENISLLKQNGIFLDYSKDANDERYNVKTLVFKNDKNMVRELIRSIKR